MSPLQTLNVIECNNCGYIEVEVRVPVANQISPAFVVPPNWTQTGTNHFLCPACSVERDA